MSCNNCFNGCTETISDQCVKYTGVNIPELNINNGDTLISVETAITTYLVSTLDGSGIYPIVDPLIICNVVSKYLAECAGCDGLSLNELLTAMVKAICDLQEQIDTINSTIDGIEGAYTVGCLEGVVSDSGTHDILQAVITKLCSVDSTLSALITTLAATNVTIDNVDEYIAAYLASDPTQTLINNRMVPYSAVPYFGSTSYFDATGAGTGDWIKIYLCNGLNGTPDLRGRALVGVTTGIPGGIFNSAVDPGLPGNPTYTQGTTTGANSVVLNATQMPNHTHTVTIDNSTAHSHYMAVGGSLTTTNDNSLYNGTFADRYQQGLSSKAYNADVDAYDYELTSSSGTINAGKTSDSGIHTHTNTVSSTGGGLGHSNIQPVYATNFIIYIP